MELKYSKGKITVVYVFDKESEFYTDAAGNIISDLDKYRMHREYENLKYARKTGVFTSEFKAIDHKTVNKLIESDNAWIDHECKRFGIGTFQNNKHLINLLIK